MKNELPRIKWVFGAKLYSDQDKDAGKLFKQLHPDDLTKFGLIPEFTDGFRFIVALDSLSRKTLNADYHRTLKNSIVKQFIPLRSSSIMLILVFLPEAIEAIAEKSIAQKTGARGLRSIVENIMVDVMYSIPSNPKVRKVTINRDTIEKSLQPVLEIDSAETA